MNEDTLFRQEAIDGQADQLLGPVSVALSFKTGALAYLFASLATMTAAYLTWGNYTRRVTVDGYILPASEVLRLYAAQSGTVTQRHVQEGALVQKGQRLFSVSGERHGESGPAQGKIAETLLARLHSFEHSMRQHQDLLKLQTQDMSLRLQLLAREIAQAGHELALSRQRLDLARQTMQRYRQLAEAGFVSPLQLQQREVERLEVAQRVSTLARTLVTLQREKAELAAQQRTLPLRQATQQAELRRGTQAVQQALLENEVLRELLVVAPEAGRVTAIAAQPGTSVTPLRPMAILIPQQAPLEAQLFAPSKAIGFIQPGARVKLRLEAFPYQKFGHVDGTVTEVARTALLAGEIQALSQMTEPLYRIRVALQKPTILAYGKETPLLPSMRVTGDIMLETRRLYEWVFEPLYSVTGKW
ncbi:HlyD family secretion protein [Paludibacterium purpuratum]|uniref:Membrane fusion protein n=1 Tax=Paludibacterium purpuratum TaxID=1144873 RepID=A0A4R7AYF8_9NEIS|nr:HlyD family efflux transporter periplasmic adaptor subunit [Paludibacterium purpuratum]TDR71605.1 membrane fusion protein [Paludibacterium purpuratum]